MSELRVLFATAELRPAVGVGGLGEAAGGLVRALRSLGVDVEAVLPDYLGWELEDERVDELDVPAWAGPARARTGVLGDTGRVTLVEAAGLARPHPYLQPDGSGWPDNDHRFASFSAAVAALARLRRPDVVHLNDWHTALTLGLLHPAPPTVLTIHTLGYQGVTGPEWAARLPHHGERYLWHGATNPLAGAIALADRIVSVSPTYAREILTPEHGMGLHDLLRTRADALEGIRNGIDAEAWNPGTDSNLASAFDASDPDGKVRCRAALLRELAWPDTGDPVACMVTRLVDQKGVDVALGAVPYLEHLRCRLVVLGSGDAWLADWARAASAERPDWVRFIDGYDATLAHRLFAGSDLLLMPSRFEPCGLAQMQAMAYGTLPVVSDVGGLHDTVVDADDDRDNGTGFVTRTTDLAGLVDGLHRAVRAWRHPARRRAIMRRGMSIDWSWTTPAERHVAIYTELARRDGGLAKNSAEY
ncbi:MAG: glycogen/starch synthase [Acidimicrobiales bacterium]|nr:glycogen/starch synthase [Acidimicrobiales bacterium]